MAEIDLFFSPSSESEEGVLNERLIRKNLRNRSNPLELPNKSFIKSFRVTKDVFKYILEQLELDGEISTSIPPVVKLACCLSLLASGSYQHQVGKDYMIGMAQSTISTISSEVLQEYPFDSY